jgi:DNA-binding CsgD family transcriptional regulator
MTSRPSEDHHEILAEARAFVGYGVGDVLPRPPVQVAEIAFIIVGVRWSERSIRLNLPGELRAKTDRSGVVYVFQSARPGPISPLSCCFTSIAVEGFDSSDGSAGHYITGGYIGGRAAPFVTQVMNGNFGGGQAMIEREGDVIRGRGGPSGRDVLRVAIRPKEPSFPHTSGVHNFLGRAPRRNGLQSYAVAFSGRGSHADPLELEIDAAAPVAMRTMEPEALLWALEASPMTITYGVPEMIGRPPPTLATTPLDALVVLGLTPAEARIALTIGRGRSPRDAAETLGVSLNTVRSTLKTIFGKLAINRQSELARIVTRLEIPAGIDQ